jgi:hypothetical protein
MLNQDTVLRNFVIALFVVVLTLIASSWYHIEDNAIVPVQKQTCKPCENTKDVSKSADEHAVDKNI